MIIYGRLQAPQSDLHAGLHGIKAWGLFKHDICDYRTVFDPGDPDRADAENLAARIDHRRLVNVRFARGAGSKRQILTARPDRPLGEADRRSGDFLKQSLR